MLLRTLLVAGCCCALIILLSCRKNSIAPDAITAIEYTISGGIIGRQTTLSITPRKQALTTNFLPTVPGKQLPCTVELPVPPADWQALTDTYDDIDFRSVPKSTTPDCCDMIYATITVNAGDVVRRATPNPLIQRFVDALETRLMTLETRCP